MTNAINFDAAAAFKSVIENTTELLSHLSFARRVSGFVIVGENEIVQSAQVKTVREACELQSVALRSVRDLAREEIAKIAK